MTRVEAHVHIGRARKGLNDCISVRDLPNGKVFYAEQVDLIDVTFSVQPAGLRKFRETGQKNVHAFVRGTVVNRDDLGPGAWWGVARYNPNDSNTFLDKHTGEPVHSASQAQVIGTSLFYR